MSLEIPRAEVEGGALLAHVLHADRFGNVMLDADRADLDACGLRRGDAVIVNGVRAAYTATFADVPPGGAAALRGQLRRAVARRQPRLGARRARAEIYARVQIAPAA